MGNFDVHHKSGRMAALIRLPDGDACVRIYNLRTKEVIGEIDPWFLPQGPLFSPDGAQLTFFGNDGKLYVFDIERQAVEQVIDDPGLDASFGVWSPSGDALAFSAFQPADKHHPPDIYTLDLPSGKVIQLTNSQAVDRFPQWSPSGRHIAFHRQHLHVQGVPKSIQVMDVVSGEMEEFMPSEGMSYDFARGCWSTDVSCLLAMEQKADVHRLQLIHVQHKQAREIAAGSDLLGATFFPDGRQILIVRQGQFEILSFPDLHCKHLIQLPKGTQILQGFRGPNVVPDDDGIGFATTDATIYRWTAHEGLRSLIHIDDCQLSKPEFEYEQYTYLAPDGRSIPAHRLIPPHPKDLAIVYVVGGPRDEISLNDRVLLRLVKEGYEVICPAYRGCRGYGVEHEDAHIGEYGRVDVADVIACGNDWRRRTGGQRPVAVMGFSYGGFLTLLSLAQADANWACGISLWGATTIENMGLHVPRAYPDDPIEREIAQVERSPIQQASKVHAPLLILHGGCDTTSTNEDVELIQARVEAAGMPCKLVIYADDGHGLMRHRREMFAEILSYLEQYAG
ncbi:S9 family peptidase [Alicyclobacillus fodiniaquatilis]|uniref:S9 family peptidase n=1 Tax=Alicyclobacillus fodiniaquatilis TaxID=1661150 RepID=A0ABW4JDT9_9BACL